jgi:hypothetical protein
LRKATVKPRAEYKLGHRTQGQHHEGFRRFRSLRFNWSVHAGVPRGVRGAQ